MSRSCYLTKIILGIFNYVRILKRQIVGRISNEATHVRFMFNTTPRGRILFYPNGYRMRRVRHISAPLRVFRFVFAVRGKTFRVLFSTSKGNQGNIMKERINTTPGRAITSIRTSKILFCIPITMKNGSYVRLRTF